MNIYDFNKMDAVDQTEALLHEGVMIGFRKEPLYKILLFQIGSFYVEVYYNPECNVIYQYKSFLNTAYLEPYLDEIELPDWIVGTKNGKHYKE